MKKKFILATIISLSVLIISSCYTPSPLYGKWQTSSGESITFLADGTFLSRIVDPKKSGEFIDYEGTWLVQENILIIDAGEGGTFLAEWEIRGSILYLSYWFGSSVDRITYFHVSK